MKHHEDNETFRSNFSKDVESVFSAIPLNPFEMDSLCALNNSIPFPPSVSDQLKQILSTGELQVKEFINKRLIMQKLPITEKNK